MSTTDHPHSRPPEPDGSRVLRQALGVISVVDRTSVAGAVDELVAVADRTGHAPLCVARQVLHLLDPQNHPTSHRGVVQAVHRRWAWPLHQHLHPTTSTVPERVWAVVLTAATTTRPPAPGAPAVTVSSGRTPRTPKAAR